MGLYRVDAVLFLLRQCYISTKFVKLVYINIYNHNATTFSVCIKHSYTYKRKSSLGSILLMSDDEEHKSTKEEIRESGSFWDSVKFEQTVDYNESDEGLVHLQTHAHINPNLYFVCNESQQIGPFQGYIRGSVRLSRPAGQPKEAVSDALDKFLANIKEMVMSSYEEEGQLDIPQPQKSGEKREFKFIRFDKGPYSNGSKFACWRKWSSDQKFEAHMV